MAFSSPGQPRAFDPMDQMPMAGSLSDTAEDTRHLDGDVEIPFEQQDLPFSSRTSLQHGHDTQAVPDESTLDYTAVQNTMLLEKPSTLSRALDLDKGYEYGPAVQFAPGFFTKMHGKQPPIHHDEQPQPLKDKHSPISSQNSRPSRPRFLSPDYGPVKQTTAGQTRQVVPADQVQTQPLTANHPSVEKCNGKPDGVVVARNNTQMAEKPPFPDTSPTKPARPVPQILSTRIESKPATSLARGEGTPLVPTPKSAITEELALGQGFHISPRRAQDDGQTTPTYLSHEYGRHIPHEKADDDGRNGRNQHPVPPMGNSRYSVMESTDCARNHVVNRPLRGTVHPRPTKPTHRARPESRSSNVSKQRLVCRFYTLSLRGKD